MNELGPEARAFLEAGRDGDMPTSADRARVKKALLISLAAGGALGAAPTSAQGALAVAGAKTAGSTLLLVAKVLGAVVILGAAGVGLARLGAPGAPASSAAPPARTEAAAIAPPPAIEAPAPTDLPAPPAIEAPAAPPVAATAAVIAAAAPTASIAPRPSSKPVAAPTAAPEGDTLEAETRRLREAHGALQGGDPGKALALLDEQSAAYEKGELREERAAARILSLCKLGRVDEARAAAARFLQESPRSPLADRVRAGCPAPTP
jgi:type IV secretory pathway VirB10-like protein